MTLRGDRSAPEKKENKENKENKKDKEDTEAEIAKYPCGYPTLYGVTALLALLTFGLIFYAANWYQSYSLYFFIEFVFAIIGTGLIAALLMQSKHKLARLLIVVSYVVVSLSSLSAYTIASPHVSVLISLTLIATCLLLSYQSALIITFLTTGGALCIHFATSAQLIETGHLTTMEEILSSGILVISAGILVLYRHEYHRRARHKAKTAFELELHAQDLYRFALFGQLAAAAAHDISNRLCLLSFDLDTINTTNAQEVLPAIKGDVQYINKLMQTTKLHFTPRSTSAPFDAMLIIHQTIKEAEQKCSQRKVLLSVHLPPEESFFIEGTALALHHILTILLNNALEACYITAPSLSKWSPQIFLSVTTDRSFLAITVLNTGPSISNHVKQSLFRPVASHKPSGMGIGLYIAHQLTREHLGGTLQAVSRDDGACFMIRLPPSKLPKGAEQDRLIARRHTRQLSHARTELELP